jgi:sialidase-1
MKINSGWSRLYAPVSLAVLFVANGASAADRISLTPAVEAKCLEILRTGLHADEFWPSIHAAEALTLAGHGDEVREFLGPKLATETDAQQRCGVARELVRAGDRAQAQVMLDILAGDDPYGHVHAAESLYKTVEIGDGTALRRAFAQTDNVRLQLMAAAALGRCGNPQAMALLREKLPDPDPEICHLAAWVLGRIGDERDIPQLRRNVATVEDPFYRSYMQNSLAALGDPQGLAALTENLDSDDARIRTYAAVFAGDARAVGVAGKLTKLLDDDTLDVRVRAAQSLLVLAQAPPPDRNEDVSVLLYQATPENPRYTEGSVLVLGDGSLLYATTEFSGSGSDFAAARIIGRESHDGGRNWGPPRVLQENTGGKNVMSVTLRRLQPPADPGTIAFFYLEKNDFDDLDLKVRFSNDDAQSFGEPVLVTADPGYHVVNNDRVTQLSTGRLLAPAASTENVETVNHFVSHCYLSDDGGRSWRNEAGSVDYARRGAMEPEVIELNDGRVLMIIRTQLGHIAAAYSEDGGDTWSEATPLDVKAPETPATLRRIPATGDLVLIWNNTYQSGAGHGGKRTPLTAAVSSDEGHTWTNVRNLESDSDRTYAYTSLVFSGERALLSYWESGPEAGMLSSRFRSLPVAWFYAAGH